MSVCRAVAGIRFSLPSISSTTLSANRFPRIAARSQTQQASLLVVGEQALAVEHDQEMDGEERDYRRSCHGPGVPAAQRPSRPSEGVGHQVRQMQQRTTAPAPVPEDGTSRAAHLLQGDHQRVGRGHLVVPIGPDQQQRLLPLAGQQVGQEPQARRIQPLQVVQEQHQRVLCAGRTRRETAETPT